MLQIFSRLCPRILLLRCWIKKSVLVKYRQLFSSWRSGNVGLSTICIVAKDGF